ATSSKSSMVRKQAICRLSRQASSSWSSTWQLRRSLASLCHRVMLGRADEVISDEAARVSSGCSSAQRRRQLDGGQFFRRRAGSEASGVSCVSLSPELFVLPHYSIRPTLVSEVWAGRA